MSSAPSDVLSALAEAVGGRNRIALIGAVARNAWAPPRATTDLDLAVAASGDLLDAIQRALRGLG